MEKLHSKEKFRPSSRIITTIGSEIIKDSYAAIIELVKNSYDADANNVHVEITKKEIDGLIEFVIRDDGHGMSKDTVVNKWLVPSTTDKLDRRTSPSGRVMQGRKGIGRFAAAVLGDTVSLETISDNICTELSIDWLKFNKKEYLDNVDIDIYTYESHKNNGTKLNIVGSNRYLEEWNIEEIDILRKELKKLVTPLYSNRGKDKFRIQFIAKGFENLIETSYDEIITPFNVLKHYNYRIFTEPIDGNNIALTYINNLTGEEKTDVLNVDLTEGERVPSGVVYDLRFFDRDKETIENLIKVISDESNDIKVNEAKRILNEISGVYIYRNNFMIRPYGDIDWLELDKLRVQDPSVKIGANQISGYISIPEEEVCHLYEKSARDGLKENVYYKGFVKITQNLIKYVEVRRYSFRKKAGIGRRKTPMSTKMKLLVDDTKITDSITSKLQRLNVSQDSILEIKDIIREDTKGKEKVAHEIERIIAIYQGQATLGKMMDVLLHEIRKPLGFLKNNNIRIMDRYNRYEKYKESQDIRKILELVPKSNETTIEISQLIARLDPLSTKPSSRKVSFDIGQILDDVTTIFRHTINESEIDFITKYDEKEKYLICGWKTDYKIALANILENAIYWVSRNKSDRKIILSIDENEDSIEISMWNNGPKIIQELLETGAIYDPGISAKESGEGTGIGLAIAGEAMDRNNSEIIAENLEEGVLFKIIAKKEIVNGKA